MLQVKKNAAGLVKQVLATHPNMLGMASFEPRHEQMTAFLQNAASLKHTSKAPESSEILGILKQMLETFEKELATAQSEERTGQKDYSNLKSAKLKQIEEEIQFIGKRVKQIAGRRMDLQTDKRDNTD